MQRSVIGNLSLAVSVAAAFSTALGGCASSGNTLPDEPVVREYNHGEWVGTPKSGLRVIVQEDHSAPLVTAVSVYGVGGSSDPKGVEGLAHFIEHLAFRSRPGGGDQFWDYLKRMGADFNAFTTNDFTVFHTTTHKDNLPLLLQLEAWRLARTIDGVTPGNFAVEREVVRNELRQRWETTAGNRMFDLLFESLYPPGHPLARPVGGTHESLNVATLDHAKAFVKEFYRPDNCTIVIAGDVDTATVKQLIGKWPGEILFGPGGPDGPVVPPRPRVGERPTPPVPPPFEKAMKRYKGPIEQPQLLLAWALPPAYRGQDELMRFAAQRLNLALGEGLDTREDDDIEGVGAFAEPFADSSAMVMMANLKPGADPDKARKRLLDVLVNAWTTESGRMQTEFTRWGAATSLLLGSSELTGTAVALGQYMGATGKTAYFKDSFESLAAVKPGDVMDFAYKWLTRDRAVAVYFEPDSDQLPHTLTGGGGAAAGNVAGAERSGHDVGRDLSAAVAEMGPDRIRQMVHSPALASVPHFKLSNGLEIYAIKQGSAPIAQIELGLRGGNASTRPVGAARLAMALARSRCRDHGDLMSVGGEIGGGVGLTASTTDVTVLSGNLANGIAVLGDNVSCREVDEEAFLFLPKILDSQSKVYKRLETRPEFWAGKRFFNELYPNHPFGEANFVDPQTLKGMKREDAQAFVQSHFRPSNGVAVVYGDVSPDDVKSLSEKYLTHWSGGAGSSMSTPPAPPGPSTRKVFLVDRPKATQATVFVGCRLADVTPERRPAYDVLGLLAGDRAWKLREEWGATYGVHASVSTRPGNSADLLLNGAVETAQVGKSVARLLAILREIGAGAVDDKLFTTMRWDAGREFMSRFASADARANAILSAVDHDWSLDVWDKYPDNLAATTTDSLKQLMGPCVGKEIVTIAGDAASLRPQLEHEGLKLQ